MPLHTAEKNVGAKELASPIIRRGRNIMRLFIENIKSLLNLGNWRKYFLNKIFLILVCVNA